MSAFRCLIKWLLTGLMLESGCYWLLEASFTAKCPTMHRTAPNVRSAKVKKPYARTRG